MTVAQTDNTIMINQTLGTNLGFELVLISGMDVELWIIWMDVCFSYHPKKVKIKTVVVRQKALSNPIFYAIPIVPYRVTHILIFLIETFKTSPWSLCIMKFRYTSWLGGFETPQEGASFESSCGQNDAWNARVANGWVHGHGLWKMEHIVISMRGGHKHT